jgi:histone H3/H4
MRLGFFFSRAAAMSLFDPLSRNPFKRLMREAMDVRFRRKASGGKR